MSLACDLCDKTSLTQVYAAPDSMRKLTVWVCSHCGLMQSLPRVDRAARRPATVSAGADWGNLRYGKGFRAEANLTTLKPYLNKQKSLRVLDTQRLAAADTSARTIWSGLPPSLVIAAAKLVRSRSL